MAVVPTGLFFPGPPLVNTKVMAQSHRAMHAWRPLYSFMTNTASIVSVSLLRDAKHPSLATQLVTSLLHGSYCTNWYAGLLKIVLHSHKVYISMKISQSMPVTTTRRLS